MDTSGTSDFANKGQAFVDNTADRLQNGIREARQGANSAASSAAGKVESLRSGAASAFDKASEQVRGVYDTVTSATQKARDFAADTQDSVVTYTREKPVKALLIAAAAGAVLVTLIRALNPSNKSS